MQTLADIAQTAIDSVAASVTEAAGDFVVSGARTGGRAVNLTVRAAYSHVSGDIAISDFGEGVEGIKAFVTSAQWTDETPPQPGDAFDLIGGGKYKAEKVETLTRGVWRVTARKVA